MKVLGLIGQVLLIIVITATMCITSSSVAFIIGAIFLYKVIEKAVESK